MGPAGRPHEIGPHDIAIEHRQPVRRTAHVERLVHRSLVLPPDDETVWAFARLRADARRLGHALQQKEHMGDLWIAATAIRWGLPLVAHDAVFVGCPGLNLITELQPG